MKSPPPPSGFPPTSHHHDYFSFSFSFSFRRSVREKSRCGKKFFPPISTVRREGERKKKGGKGESSSSSGGGFWISQRRKTLRFPPSQTKINSYFFTGELPCSQLSLQDFTENDLFSFLLLLPKLHLLMLLGAPVLKILLAAVNLKNGRRHFPTYATHRCFPFLKRLFNCCEGLFCGEGSQHLARFQGYVSEEINRTE